jgi:hypothetical protein
MATIYDSPDGAVEVQQRALVYDVLSNVNEDKWSPEGWWGRTKWQFLRLGAWLCCSSATVDVLEYEIRVRNDIRRAFMTTLSPRGESVPAAAAFEVFETTGYDMMGFRRDHQQQKKEAILDARKAIERAIALEEQRVHDYG